MTEKQKREFLNKLKETYRDDLSDEEYNRIYNGDQDAIREAKESWKQAGEQVIADYERNVVPESPWVGTVSAMLIMDLFLMIQTAFLMDHILNPAAGRVSTFLDGFAIGVMVILKFRLYRTVVGRNS